MSFLKNNLKIKKIVTQKEFLEKMGIIQRAAILSKKMNRTIRPLFKVKKIIKP